MKYLSDKFDEVKSKDNDSIGWEETMKIQMSFNLMHDQVAGGHWILDAATARDVFDFTTAIFGTDGRLTKSYWFA
jgi:hypothetical protein